MKDHLVRALTGDGSLRAIAAVTTETTENIRRFQGTDPTATVALGRLVTGAALMGSLLKGEQRVALMVEGNGPLQKLHAESDAKGHIRGSVKVPCSGIAPTEEGFDVAAAVGGAGFLHVTKDLGLKEPYRGMVQLYRSTIAEDLAYYFTASEQTPSTVALGVYVEPDGRISSAGGFLIQAMPDCAEGSVALIEERLLALPAVTTLLRRGLGPVHILEEIFSGLELSLQEETDLKFRCNCSRDQVRLMLQALGDDELRELSRRKEPTTVTCEFCRAVYPFSPEELAGLAE